MPQTYLTSAGLDWPAALEENALQHEVWALRAELLEAMREADQDTEARNVAPKSFQETQNWGRATARLQKSLKSDARYDAFAARAKAATAHRVAVCGEATTEVSRARQMAVLSEQQQRLLSASAKRSAKGLAAAARASAARAETSERHARLVGARAQETARRAGLAGTRISAWDAEANVREHAEAARASYARDQMAAEAAWTRELEAREARERRRRTGDARARAAKEAAAASVAEKAARRVTAMLVERFDVDEPQGRIFRYGGQRLPIARESDAIGLARVSERDGFRVLVAAAGIRSLLLPSSAAFHQQLQLDIARLGLLRDRVGGCHRVDRRAAARHGALQCLMARPERNLSKIVGCKTGNLRVFRNPASSNLTLLPSHPGDAA